MPDFLSFFSLTTDQMFLEILNRSLAAIPVILAVMITRRILKKLPRRLTVILWLVVFFRLLVPFTLESSAGLLPQEPVISPSAAAGETVPFSRTLYTARQITEAAISDTLDPLYIIKTPQEMYYLSPSEFLLIFCGHIWGIGMAAMALYSLVSFLRLKKRLVGAMKLRDNIWLSDDIDTPFVTGVIRPKIYLPSDLSDTDRDVILAHERTHIRHLDPTLKLFAWFGLCLHWFNPLVWLCFRLMVADMETTCDEAVTAHLSPEERADYADTLLRLATGKRAHAVAPLAFGEGDAQSRIRRIFDFRKPQTAITILAAALVVVLSFYLVTEHRRDTHLLGGGYKVSEILYAATITDPTPLSVSNAPDFCITGDYHLLFRYPTLNPNRLPLNIFDYAPTGMWKGLGQFRPSPLDRSELMELLPADDAWSNSWRPGSITEAWWLQSGDEVGTFFLLFQTSAGDTLLAIGYEDISERGQVGSDDTTIHFLFRLETPASVLYSSPNSYVALDVDFMMSFEGVHPEIFHDGSSLSEEWRLCGFTTDDDGLGFASYRWVDGYHKLIDIHYYSAEELPSYQFSVPGCYIAPDPATRMPKDDPNRPVFNSETYDVVFICNEEVTTVKRIVTNSDGIAVSEHTVIFESDPNRPQLLDFSWSQEEGRNPCSVRYRFYDKDGNELT